MERLVIFSSDYPPNSGGISRLCSEIRNQCIKNNINFIVVTLVNGPEEEHTVRIPGKKPLSYINAVKYLKSIKQEGDVALSALYHPDGFITKLAGIKTVSLAHGAEVLTSNSIFKNTVWALYRRFALAKMDKILSNSHYTAGLVRKCSPKANVTPIPLAVDNVYFHPTLPKRDDGILHICSISRLLQFKGHDFIIKTIAGLPDEYKKRLHLTIGGKGEYKANLESMVKELGLENTISFCGFVADDKLSDFYSQNDLFILATREDKTISQVEGFGLVFTEAQACGTPCIGTRAGGIPDAICDGYGGWLIDQDNEEQLASLLKKLIDNPDICKCQSSLALERIVEGCTWDVYFKKLYSELLKY